jgi:membrane-associated phospholipid phosphatase
LVQGSNPWRLTIYMSNLKNFGLISLLVASFLIYFPLNHPTAVSASLRTPFDDLLPLIPALIVPYLLHWVVLVGSLVYFFLKDRRVFNLVTAAYILANFGAAIIYVLAQTSIDRPEIIGADIFSNLLRWLYSVDSPYSAWPSLHTAGSIIYAWGWWQIKRRWGRYAWAFTLVVIASTVLLKQHYVLDILGGILFAYGALWLSELINRKN